MVEEAKLVETESGLEAEGPGWFVVNARDAAWWRHRGVFGYGCPFGHRSVCFEQAGSSIRRRWIVVPFGAKTVPTFRPNWRGISMILGTPILAQLTATPSFITTSPSLFVFGLPN